MENEQDPLKARMMRQYIPDASDDDISKALELLEGMNVSVEQAQPFPKNEGADYLFDSDIGYRKDRASLTSRMQFISDRPDESDQSMLSLSSTAYPLEQHPSSRNVQFKSDRPLKSDSAMLTSRSYGSSGLSSSGGSSNNGCFIATAVYGDFNSCEVRFLRAFREDFLLKRSLGRFLASLYYKIGPIFAMPVRNIPLLKQMTRKFLNCVIRLIERRTHLQLEEFNQKIDSRK